MPPREIQYQVTQHDSEEDHHDSSSLTDTSFWHPHSYRAPSGKDHEEGRANWRAMSSGVSLPLTSTRRKSGEEEVRQPLDSSFKPTKFTVICGRGSVCCNSSGNLHLKRLVYKFAKPYETAVTKSDKTKLVASILAAVKKAASPDAAFVKFEEGRWWNVGDQFAKEKIGALLRDALPGKYKSSSIAKNAKKTGRDPEAIVARDGARMTSSSSPRQDPHVSQDLFSPQQPQQHLMDETVEGPRDLVFSLKNISPPSLPLGRNAFLPPVPPLHSTNQRSTGRENLPTASTLVSLDLFDDQLGDFGAITGITATNYRNIGNTNKATRSLYDDGTASFARSSNHRNPKEDSVPGFALLQDLLAASDQTLSHHQKRTIIHRSFHLPTSH